MPEATCTPNAMQIGFRRLWKVKIDDNINGLNVNTTCEEVGGNEVTSRAIAELVEDAITMRLLHLSVDVKARVAEFGDLFGE